MKKALLTLAILPSHCLRQGVATACGRTPKILPAIPMTMFLTRLPQRDPTMRPHPSPSLKSTTGPQTPSIPNIGSYELSKKSPVYTKRFTNQNDPSDNAIFGQVMTEQVSDRLVQRGVVITSGEPKAQNYFLPQGVDPKKYSNPVKDSLDKLPPRAARLTGTYVIGDNYIYMAAKITRLDDNAIISGHNWTIPITDNVRELLPQLKQDNGMEPTVKTKFD